jgi:hypothetical protein
MVDYWFPAYGHPEGDSDEAWFRVVGGKGFRVVDGHAYPTLSLPHNDPTFAIVGSFAHSEQGARWFRIEQRSH